MRVTGGRGVQPWWVPPGPGRDAAAQHPTVTSEPAAPQARTRPRGSASMGTAEPDPAFARLTPDAAGRIDFVRGLAAGVRTGVLPEGATVASVCFAGAGTVTWFGAVGADEKAQDPSQRADLPRGTLTAMQFQFDEHAGAVDRATLIRIGITYASDVSTGASASWGPHALYPGDGKRVRGT